jgi:hypothetical protein
VISSRNTHQQETHAGSSVDPLPQPIDPTAGFPLDLPSLSGEISFNNRTRCSLAVSSGLVAAASQAQGVSFIAHRDFDVARRNPQSVAVGDFNGDGVPDLAVANSISANVSLLINNTPQ